MLRELISSFVRKAYTHSLLEKKRRIRAPRGKKAESENTPKPMWYQWLVRHIDRARDILQKHLIPFLISVLVMVTVVVIIIRIVSGSVDPLDVLKLVFDFSQQ